MLHGIFSYAICWVSQTKKKIFKLDKTFSHELYWNWACAQFHLAHALILLMFVTLGFVYLLIGVRSLPCLRSRCKTTPALYEKGGVGSLSHIAPRRHAPAVADVPVADSLPLRRCRQTHDGVVVILALVAPGATTQLFWCASHQGARERI